MSVLYTWYTKQFKYEVRSCFECFIIYLKKQVHHYPPLKYLREEKEEKKSLEHVLVQSFDHKKQAI